MKKVELCPQCRIPLMISKELRWEDNGLITVARSPANRMVLYESRVIDNLFRGIEELIGMPIEHIVIESRRREVRRYIEKKFPPWIRRSFLLLKDHMVGEGLVTRAVRKPVLLIAKKVTMRVMEIGTMYGYGYCVPGEPWGTGDPFPWRNNVISRPYSVPFWVADALGSAEAIEGEDLWARYEKLGEESYRVVAYPSEHPVELRERLRRRRYPFKPGNIAYERCPACGLPVELGRYRWDTEEGTITDTENGWRMAIFGPSALEAVLDDLQSELGEEIPQVIVEAQRRYVKERTSEMNWRRGGTTFNRLAALRGMGNLTFFEADEKHLSLTIENSCLPHLMVGMAQALYEIALNLEKTTCEWEQSEDGDLHIEVRI